MKIILKIIFWILFCGFILYLVIPNPSFPAAPPDSLQSQEKGDTETPLRRAYFTNYTRQEVMDHYTKEFSKTNLGFDLPVLWLNYPPEEAQERIRDQTRSTFLQEIVRPFRESIYVNGFEPKDAKDAVIIDGTTFRQKIIVKYNMSSVASRVTVAILAAGAFMFLSREWGVSLAAFKKNG